MSGRGIRTIGAAALGMCLAVSGVCRASNQPPAPENTAAALYDAGNAQARSGHPALAVLYFERARLLAPDDPDIAANLRLVRMAAGLPPQTGGWLWTHDRVASPDTMYWLGLFGVICAGVSLLALRARRRRSQLKYRVPLRILATLGGLFTLLGVGDALAVNSLLHEYVVLDASPATGSPVSNGAPLFTVSPADVVQVRDHHRDFLLVRDSAGRQGWVPRSRLKAVVPDSVGGLPDD